MEDEETHRRNNSKDSTHLKGDEASNDRRLS